MGYRTSREWDGGFADAVLFNNDLLFKKSLVGQEAQRDGS